jgi:hypothetical protein
MVISMEKSTKDKSAQPIALCAVLYVVGKCEMLDCDRYGLNYANIGRTRHAARRKRCMSKKAEGVPVA